jgi:hypothetical protein
MTRNHAPGPAAPPVSGRARRLRLWRFAVFATITMIAVVVTGTADLAIRASSTMSGPPHVPQDPDRSVMAGHEISYPCYGNFYARHGTTVVLLGVSHCRGAEGSVAVDATGQVLGTWGPNAPSVACPTLDHLCPAADMAYIALAPDRVPWGRLDLVGLGSAGMRDLGGRAPLRCGEIAVGDRVEINGIAGYRTGTVTAIAGTEGGPGVACMVHTDIPVTVGDSGGPVLVNGVPGGISTSGFGGLLGFASLGEGLAALGLTLCVDPECGLHAPAPVLLGR